MANPGNGERTDGISKKATHPPGRQSPLAMDAATFRAVGHRLVDQLAELLESVPRRPVTHDESPSAVRDALDLKGPLPERGTEAGPLLDHFHMQITASALPAGAGGGRSDALLFQSVPD